MQRFQLVIFPEIKGKWKNHDVAPNVKAQKKVEYLIHKLYSFESPDNEKPIGLRFDDESQEIFNI